VHTLAQLRLQVTSRCLRAGRGRHPESTAPVLTTDDKASGRHLSVVGLILNLPEFQLPTASKGYVLGTERTLEPRPAHLVTIRPGMSLGTYCWPLTFGGCVTEVGRLLATAKQAHANVVCINKWHCTEGPSLMLVSFLLHSGTPRRGTVSGGDLFLSCSGYRGMPVFPSCSVRECLRLSSLVLDRGAILGSPGARAAVYEAAKQLCWVVWIIAWLGSPTRDSDVLPAAVVNVHMSSRVQPDNLLAALGIMRDTPVTMKKRSARHSIISSSHPLSDWPHRRIIRPLITGH